MPRPCSRVLSLLLAVVILCTSSCGTIIYPQRVDQPYHGRLDPSIVLLDGLGLLLFLVPGVIAFVVDFATGAIYLPAGQAQAGGERDWRIVQIPPEELTPQRIKTVVYQQTGRRVDLDDEELRVRRLEALDEASEFAASPNGATEHADLQDSLTYSPTRRYRPPRSATPARRVRHRPTRPH